MTVQEQVLLKQWLTNEELRLASRVDVLRANMQIHNSIASAIQYAQALIEWREFKRCMRSLDCLLNLFS